MKLPQFVGMIANAKPHAQVAALRQPATNRVGRALAGHAWHHTAPYGLMHIKPCAHLVHGEEARLQNRGARLVAGERARSMDERT